MLFLMSAQTDKFIIINEKSQTIVVAKMLHDALERIHGGLTSGTSQPFIHGSAKPSGPRIWSTALEGEEIMCLDRQHNPGPRGRYL